MIPLFYDFHMHSCLSPCGDDDMTPANLVGMAFVNGLQAIALTDHNSCLNCPAAYAHAAEYGITFIPGMELTTMEEVHVLCLFPTVERALRWSEYVYPRILNVKNKPEIFGNQRVMNEEDVQVDEIEKLLISATDISFDAVYDLMEEFGGVMVPAHVDAGSYGLIANLGFVPPESRFRTAEFEHEENVPVYEKADPYFGTCRKIYDSDAHYLENISEAVHVLHVEENTPEAILKVLKEGLRTEAQ
ncbi:MAG: PHP domain-containing protein [Lachnospiraceae bacterium]|nr:PHP domain-containing protein [Lachnospiraceae bacterium]